MMIHNKIAINYNNISHIIIQELNNEEYKKLLINKPKIFNINQLYQNQYKLWNKLQQTYFNIFINNYDIFINHILNVKL